MVVVIGIMLAGVLLGYVMRGDGRRLRPINKVIIGLIWLLLFLLGVEVGGNRAIVTGLHSLGLDAVIITSGAVVGSALGAWALWRFVSRRDARNDDARKSSRR